MELSPTQRKSSWTPEELSPQTALNPDLVVSYPVLVVCILTVMVGPVLVKGPGVEEPQNFSEYDP